MKKKILVISILAIILPIIGISVINILEDNTKINFSYIVMPLLLLSIVFSIYMILLSYKDKINKKMKYVLKKEFFKNWDLEKGLYKIVCDTSLKGKKEYVLFEIK